MPTVLVVDDSAVDRRLVGGLLEKDADLKVQYAIHGAEALAKMGSALPDLVVTDLIMPEMDGLELVRAIRFHYPGVPVILATGHGSEELAVEALAEGAASYVTKSKLADTLQDTVEEVLSLASADRSYERLLDCCSLTRFTYDLDNDASLIDPLVDLVQQIVSGLGVCDITGRMRVGMALEQALLNALYRGNLEISPEQMEDDREAMVQGKQVSLVEQRRSQPPYGDRKIFVDVQISPEEARFVIRDEGPGFDLQAVPAAGDPEPFQREGAGRGLVLIKSFMDEVIFNQTGNEVTMVTRREAE